jgi:hypothetical protein
MSTLQNPSTRAARRSLAPPTAPETEIRPVIGPVREQFIPLRKSDLVETLASLPELGHGEGDAFRRLCCLVHGLVHRDYQATLEELKDDYAPFDPDADTRRGGELTPEELDDRRGKLFERFNWLLQRGNFTHLDRGEIERALGKCSQWGLNLAVDFKIFDRLEIYARGDVTGKRTRRRLRQLFRPEVVDLPMYQRLVVIFRLRPSRQISRVLDTHDVYIKIFKEIPKPDLDMLLPGTQVRMSLFDRAKIVLPTLSGVSIAIWKMVQGAFLVAAAGFYGSMAFLGLVGGTLGYGVRSFYGYLNTKQKYQLNLTQSLYYQNLDNNAGAIFRLLDEAEEQESREAMLAYFYLWRSAPPHGWRTEELDAHIEAFLRTAAERDVDFEVGDAMAKIERLQIVEPCPGGKWRAVPIDKALRVLERRWAILPD